MLLDAHITNNGFHISKLVPTNQILPSYAAAKMWLLKLLSNVQKT